MHRRDFLSLTAVAGWPWLARAADPDPRLRVVVIGHTGRGDYGHGIDTMWSHIPETVVVAVADADPAGLAQARQRLQVERGFADYREMLTEVRPDIVAIGPRHADQHRDMALAAVNAGARGLYIEKPFCRTPAEADEIVEACERGRVKCAVAHRNRWHPAIPVVEQLIQAGTIGRLLEIRTRGKEDARGGAEDLWVLGSHALNLAFVFSGAPTSCSATLLSQGRPATAAEVRQGGDAIGPIAGDELHARWQTEKGIPLFFDSLRGANVPGANFGVQLIGTQGMIDLRIDLPELAHLVPGSTILPTDRPRPWTLITSAGAGLPEPENNLRERIASHEIPGRDLVQSILEDRQPSCSANDGRDTIEAISSALASHRQNGARVAIPLQERAHPFDGWS